MGEPTPTPEQIARQCTRGHAVVEYRPEEVGPIVTMHAHWLADNGHETATFSTEAEAVAFAWKRWRLRSVVRRDEVGAARWPKGCES